MPKTKAKERIQHPWRACPSGEHWVSTHPRHVPKGVTTVDGHCRMNPSRKDRLYSDELVLIAEKHFSKLRKLPTPDKLKQSNGNDYDRLIAGWTKYWNDVLNPRVRLDPNLVKALIYTESRFKESAEALAFPGNRARGLMQVTDQTLKILADEKGELKDHLMNIDRKDIYDPNLNIAAGVR